MSLARRHREATLAQQTASAPASGGGSHPAAVIRTTAAGSPAERMLAEMKLRLRHDLQRLKEIKSIQLKITAKRAMLPAYHAWCDGLLEAGRITVGNDLSGPVDEVLPTIMVWAIDTCDWPRALDLAAHVLRFRIPLPKRYNRDAPTLIVEQTAEEALNLQKAGEVFPFDVLERVEDLTRGMDMFDEVRAKLDKAIGFELARASDAFAPGTPEFIVAAERALGTLRQAQKRNDRVGVKDKIKRLEKALAPPKPTSKPTGTLPAA